MPVDINPRSQHAPYIASVPEHRDLPASWVWSSVPVEMYDKRQRRLKCYIECFEIDVSTPSS